MERIFMFLFFYLVALEKFQNNSYMLGKYNGVPSVLGCAVSGRLFIDSAFFLRNFEGNPQAAHSNLYFSPVFDVVVGRCDRCEHLPPTQNYIMWCK